MRLLIFGLSMGAGKNGEESEGKDNKGIKDASTMGDPIVDVFLSAFLNIMRSLDLQVLC